MIKQPEKLSKILDTAQCTVKVDMRLTPAFGAMAAEALLRSLAAGVDAAWPGTPPLG
jgi:hypothetical protein